MAARVPFTLRLSPAEHARLDELRDEHHVASKHDLILRQLAPLLRGAAAFHTIMLRRHRARLEAHLRRQAAALAGEIAKIDLLLNEHALRGPVRAWLQESRDAKSVRLAETTAELAELTSESTEESP